MMQERKHVQGPVYGVGQCSLDYLGTIAAYPPSDAKCEFKNLTIQGGGPVATALVALARWGVACRFAGVVGDDLFGKEILASLGREGVSTDDCLVRPNGRSQFAFIAAQPAVAHRVIFWQRPQGGAFSPAEVNADAIRRAGMLYTDGFFPEAAIRAAEIAREAGVPVLVDAGSLRKGMLRLCGLSTWWIASAVFAEQYLPGKPVEEVCRHLAAFGPVVSGVTLGRDGYVACTDEGVVRSAVWPVTAIDTTGCGDVFHAGFAYGVLQGWTAKKALAFGAFAAAMVSRYLGGRAGIPGRSMVEEWEKSRETE